MIRKLPPLIATPHLDTNYLSCRGSNIIIKIPNEALDWLQEKKSSNGYFSEQFVNSCKENWDLNVSQLTVSEAIHFRERPIMEYTEASYEINLACNYRCEHCYLDENNNR